MKYKIKNIKLKNRFLLAPMLEPNDIAFRLLCKKSGCGLTYTGMISPLSKQKISLQDKPALQLFGNSIKGIQSFIKKYNTPLEIFNYSNLFTLGFFTVIDLLLMLMGGATSTQTLISKKSKH